MDAHNFVIAERLTTPIAIVNEHGGIEWSNPAFEGMFGIDAKDWLQQAARVVGGERGWLQDFFMDGVEEHRAVDVEIEGRTFRVEHILNIGGESSRAVALWFEDVTQQRQMEQAKSDFTAQIVHDLRGPLSGNLVIEKEPVRVAGVLKRAVRSLQQVASRDEVFLLSAHGRDVPQVIGSVEKMTQAIINLVSNSLKFTPKKGLISVGAQIVRNEDVPESIVITVTDSGMGIKADELEQIWKKYKQSGTKSLRGGSGTGLGLYIVKQIVEAHGGEISVASIEGIGTSMVIKLPVKKASDTGVITASRTLS